MVIPCFLDRGLLNFGVKDYVPLDFEKQIHNLVLGATGTGKTYAVKLILGRIATHIPNAKVYVCDYKHDDFRFLEGASRYFWFDGCTEGLNAFFEEFQARQSGKDSSREFRLLVFDEWAAYVSMLDKKAAEDAKRKMAVLLMLTRSYSCHILLSQQRGDSSYFATARDNLNIIALGNLSKESREMFFSNFRDEIQPVHQLGEGYMLVNGATLHHMQVPTVRDTAKLDAAIRRLVT